MKKIFLFLLIALAVYLAGTFYYMDRVYFFCPVKYEGDILIRSDRHGNGYFAAQRSGRRLHKGIDLFAEVGEPVYASRSGKVVSARQNKGMGKYIIIRHRGRLMTIYGHLSEIGVKKGCFVRQGDFIGRVGKTGNARLRDIQPHLHFEVRKNGMPEDPLEYLQ
jgi:murein DD-endopeptidase MepM/ murein hydrolase activator NlpD